MISPRQYAEKIERPYTTVMTWLQGGLFPEAEKHETPTGHYWLIPEAAKPPELKPGPKPAAEAVENPEEAEKPKKNRKGSKKEGN